MSSFTSHDSSAARGDARGDAATRVRGKSRARRTVVFFSTRARICVGPNGRTRRATGGGEIARAIDGRGWGARGTRGGAARGNVASRARARPTRVARWMGNNLSRSARARRVVRVARARADAGATSARGVAPAGPSAPRIASHAIDPAVRARRERPDDARSRVERARENPSIDRRASARRARASARRVRASARPRVRERFLHDESRLKKTPPPRADRGRARSATRARTHTRARDRRRAIETSALDRDLYRSFESGAIASAAIAARACEARSARREIRRDETVGRRAITLEATRASDMASRFREGTIKRACYDALRAAGADGLTVRARGVDTAAMGRVEHGPSAGRVMGARADADAD